MKILNKDSLERFYQKDLDSDDCLFDSLLELLIAQFTELSGFVVKAENLTKLSQLAHKIKSGARSFGAEVIADQLQEFESCAKNKNLSACLLKREQLVKNMEQVKKEIVLASKSFPSRKVS